LRHPRRGDIPRDFREYPATQPADLRAVPAKAGSARRRKFLKSLLFDAMRAAVQGCAFGAFFVLGAIAAAWAVGTLNLLKTVSSAL